MCFNFLIRRNRDMPIICNSLANRAPNGTTLQLHTYIIHIDTCGNPALKIAILTISDAVGEHNNIALKTENRTRIGIGIPRVQASRDDPSYLLNKQAPRN